MLRTRLPVLAALASLCISQCAMGETGKEMAKEAVNAAACTGQMSAASVKCATAHALDNHTEACMAAARMAIPACDKPACPYQKIIIVQMYQQAMRDPNACGGFHTQNDPFCKAKEKKAKGKEWTCNDVDDDTICRRSLAGIAAMEERYSKKCGDKLQKSDYE